MRDDVLNEIMVRRGANKAISEACGLSSAAVSQWKRVPKKHVEIVAKVTGVAASKLRPDLLPRRGDIAA